MRYLVTGGAGFIGSHLVDALAEREDRVVVLDDFSTGSRANLANVLATRDVEIVEGSVLNQALVDWCMRSVDVCLHLASPVGVQLVVGSPLETLLRNVRGTDVVMSSAARHGRRLIFTSSSEVYGKNSTGPLAEDDDRVLGSSAKSRWSYATAKGFGEALACSYYREHNAANVVVRLFNTVGPRQSGAYGMVLPRFVRQALRDRDLTVYGDGTQSRCFCHVTDVVQALLALLGTNASNGQIFNIGSSTQVSVVELARRVIDHADSRSRIRFVSYEQAYDEGFEELGRRTPDTSRLHELTGWEPRHDIDDAIRDTLAYERIMSGEPVAESIAG